MSDMKERNMNVRVKKKKEDKNKKWVESSFF